MVKYRWRKDIDLHLHLVSLVLHHWRSQSKSRQLIVILSIDSVDHGWYIPGKGKLWLGERFAQGTRQEGGGKRTWGEIVKMVFIEMTVVMMKVTLVMVEMFWPGSNGEEGGGEEVHPQELFRPASIRGWILFLNIFFHPPLYCDYVNYIQLQLKTNLVVSLMMMPATE